MENDYTIIYGTVFSQQQQTIIKDYCNKRELKMISVIIIIFGKHNHLDLNPTFTIILKTLKLSSLRCFMV